MRWRGCAVHVVLAIVSTMATLLIAEAALRASGERRLLFTPVRYLFRPDPETGYDLAPNVSRRPHVFSDGRYDVWTNELGCFDRPYHGERPYLLLVGDSFTEYYAPFERKWGTLLEASLGQRVLKCGVGGYGTAQELVKARRLVAAVGTAPQTIVVGYYVNDLGEDALFPQETVIDGWPVKTRRFRSLRTGEIVPVKAPDVLGAWLRTHSILYNMTRLAVRDGETRHGLGNVERFPELLYAAPYGWVPQALAEHLQNLARFQELAASLRARLLVVMIPSKAQVHPDLYRGTVPAGDREAPQRIVGAFLEARGIEHIDLLPAFRGHAAETYWAIDSHWNEEGNRLAATLVAERIAGRR